MSKPHKLHVPAGLDPNIGLLLKSSGLQNCGISEADFILYPQLVRSESNVRATLVKIARQYDSLDKKVIVFILDDFEGVYPFHANLCLLRTSAQADKLAGNEHILPYVWECRHEPFVPAPPTDSPSVGFCGLLSKPRKKLVAAFENSGWVKCDFIKRGSFWGGAPHAAGVKSDFWNNLQKNQFALAPRGAGNFSMRFYQALSVGRIPVLINTNLALPIAHLIPWQKIIVLENDESQCLERVREIHASGLVTARQEMCYRMFHENLSHRVFLHRLLDHLQNGS